MMSSSSAVKIKVEGDDDEELTTFPPPSPHSAATPSSCDPVGTTCPPPPPPLLGKTGKTNAMAAAVPSLLNVTVKTENAEERPASAGHLRVNPRKSTATAATVPSLLSVKMEAGPQTPKATPSRAAAPLFVPPLTTLEVKKERGKRDRDDESADGGFTTSAATSQAPKATPASVNIIASPRSPKSKSAGPSKGIVAVGQKQKSATTGAPQNRQAKHTKGCSSLGILRHTPFPVGKPRVDAKPPVGTKPPATPSVYSAAEQKSWEETARCKSRVHASVGAAILAGSKPL